MKLRLAIGCSNLLFANGLQELLEDERNIEIIGIFSGGEGDSLPDLKKIQACRPDVILADYTPDLNSLFIIPDEYSNENPVKIILIGDKNLRLIADVQLREFVLRGIVGVLPPSADSALLKKALRAVAQGELWLDRQMLTKILTAAKSRDKSRNLAKREQEIIMHICQGYRNKEIAQKLNISEQTVKSHCNRIYRKLGVSDRLQLALYSYRIWPENT
ncbi:MAG: LuxR C-terminal-related transcriptional regulator [Nitrospirota bacterium]